MKPVHGDTASNDCSSSTWCGYSNQSGVSFRNLSSLQGARAERILHEKYIPLKENNLLQKLVKTRVLYEELRHQILSGSLSTSKSNLLAGKPSSVSGNHILKANKSKIIKLVDLVDKGVILRPEKLCACCDCSSYNSETRSKNGPKESRQKQIHAGGCLTSKSSVISKKTTIGEWRLDTRLKTKNIKSDPCTFQFREYMKPKSRDALTRDRGKPSINMLKIFNKNSQLKTKLSKLQCMDEAKLSALKIKEQTVLNLKEIKPIARKSLDSKPSSSSNSTQKTLITNVPIKTDVIETCCDGNYYVETWNFKSDYDKEKVCHRNSLKRAENRIQDSYKKILPANLDNNTQAENNTSLKMDIGSGEFHKKGTARNELDNVKLKKLNENPKLLELNEILERNQNCPAFLQGQNSNFAKLTNLSSTSFNASVPRSSTVSTLDAKLLLSETKCKTRADVKHNSKVQKHHTNDVPLNLHKRKIVKQHTRTENPDQNTNEKPLSINPKKMSAVNPDQIKRRMRTSHNNNKKSKAYDKIIINITLPQQYRDKHSFEKNNCECRQKRVSKNIKNRMGKRSICTSKHKHINYERNKIFDMTDRTDKHPKYLASRPTSLKIDKTTCDPLIDVSCSFDKHDLRKEKSWLDQFVCIEPNLTFKSLSKNNQSCIMSFPRQLKTSYVEYSPIANLETRAVINDYNLRKCLCSLKQGAENSILKPTTLSKATMIALNRVIVGHKMESEFRTVNGSSLSERSLVNYYQKSEFNPFDEFTIYNTDAKYKLPMMILTKSRKTKSTAIFTSQPSFKPLPETRKVNSCTDIDTKVFIEACKQKSIIENIQVNTEKETNDLDCIQFVKKCFESAHSINNFNQGHNIPNDSSKNNQRSQNYKLIKILKEAYLIVSPCSKCHLPTFKDSEDMTDNNYANQYLDKDINNKLSELLINTPSPLQSFLYQCHLNYQKNVQKHCVDKNIRKTEALLQENRSNSKILEQGTKVKNWKSKHQESGFKIIGNRTTNVFKYVKHQKHYDESFGNNSMSPKTAIKRENKQHHRERNLLSIQISQNQILQIKSSLTCELSKSISSKNINKMSSEEYSLGDAHSEIKSLKSSNIYISHDLKPRNHQLTGVSTLLRRSFYTMNIHVGRERDSINYPYSVQSNECCPYDYMPYECDPYECQKLMKRSMQKRSKNKRYSSSESSKSKIAKSNLMSGPNKLHSCGCNRMVDCQCKKPVRGSKRSSHVNFSKSRSQYYTSDRRSRNICSNHNCIALETQSNIRKVHHKSSTVSPLLKRCFCTMKFQREQANNRLEDFQTMSSTISSSKKENKTRHITKRNQTTTNICKCEPNEHLELKTKRKRRAKGMASNAGSGILSKPKIRKHSQIQYKRSNKSIRAREPTYTASKTPSTLNRQVVRVGSSFQFSVEFYKDNKAPIYEGEKKYVQKGYEQGYLKHPKLGSRNVISQTENLKKDSKKAMDTSSHIESLRNAQTSMARSVLKRCFCTARLQGNKKKRPSKIYKNVSIGTTSKILQESVIIQRPVKVQTRSNECQCMRSFVQSQCDCLKCMCKKSIIYKHSESNVNARDLLPKQSSYKRHKHKGSETERQLIKCISCCASPKTSKSQITQSKYHNLPSPETIEAGRTSSPEIQNDDYSKEESLRRQSVRIGSSFSFDIEFQKDQLFPKDEKVQAAAEAIKTTRDKMHAVHRISRHKSKSIKSFINSISSEINSLNGPGKVVGPMLRRCFCTLKLQGENQDQQDGQPMHPDHFKSVQSIDRGTGTPFCCPIANLHDRGTVTVYKLKTYPYKLAPHECEPGVCVPGECDPYECLKRMNRRHAGSSTDGYSTKSAVSMTGPGRRHRDNRVQFSPREKRPRTREGHTKPQTVSRPRHGGIDVRHRPKSSTAGRQAVKIGSNFSFNVEFYKDTSQGEGKTCPQPCPEMCPKTCPKRFANSGTDAYSVPYRNKKAQRKHGHTQNRDSQVWGRKMRSTMTGVGPFLKRCFCTLQLQKRNQKEMPHRSKRRDSESSSVGTETGKYHPPVHYREQGTRPRKKQRYHGRTLDPNECEPGVCIPGQCDPYVCLERIKRREMQSRHTGTSRNRIRSVSSSITNPYQRHKNRSVSSSMLANRRPHRPMKTQKNYKPVRVKEYAPRPRASPAPAGRQAVRIGSSFSFNIEFYKDRNQGTPSRPAMRERPVKYIKRPVPGRRIRTDSIGSGPMSARSRNMSSSYKNRYRNRGQQANSKTLLKRCFCTLKLQKIGTRQRETQESSTTIGTVYRTAGAQIKRKREIVPQYREYGTRARKLLPYECEPGVCIPGQCDPYECLERIKGRYLRHSGTGMSYPDTRSMSNFTPQYYRSRSMNTAMRREPRKKYQGKQTGSPRLRQPPPQRRRQPPPRPSRAQENIHNRQAVRLGSSFSFNVEFYKDRAAQRPQSTCHPAICKEPECTTLKCKTSSCSTSCPIKNQRSRNLQYHGGGHDRRLQARGGRTESTGSGSPMLKRCFCTLTLQRAEVKCINPFNANCHDQSTLTKNKYFFSDSTQQSNLSNDYYGSDLSMSECDPNCSGSNWKKGRLRRISRIAGSYMARSRDVSRDKLASRFTSNDTRWYDRSPWEREETIVEEPRFKMFHRPNVKHTVRISSNCNFNIEIFKDVVLPEPDEIDEESDEMSAITKLQQVIYPRRRSKKHREDQLKPYYEGDSVATERYRSKYKHKKFSSPSYGGDTSFSTKSRYKTLTARNRDEHASKSGNEPSESLSLSRKTKTSKTSKTGKELDDLSIISKTCKDCCSDQQSRKTKSKKAEIELDGLSIISKTCKDCCSDQQSRKTKSNKAEKELDGLSIISETCKDCCNDKQSRKSKADKTRKSKSKKETKNGKETIEHTPPDKKNIRPIDKLFKCLRSSKPQNECLCCGCKTHKVLTDENALKVSTDANAVKLPKGKKKSLRSSKPQNECFCCGCKTHKILTNDNALIVSTEANAVKVPKSNKKSKCLCPSAEQNVVRRECSNCASAKQGTFCSKKIKNKDRDNVFVNKAITVARVEMGFQKQKSKLSGTRQLIRQKSSKCCINPEYGARDQIMPHKNYTKNNVLRMTLLNFLKPKRRRSDPKTSAADNFLIKDLNSEIPYCENSLNKSISEQISKRHTPVTDDLQATALKIIRDKQSTNLTVAVSEQINSKTTTSVLSTSQSLASISKISIHNSYTTISNSKSNVHAYRESSNEHINIQYNLSETDIITRLAEKLRKPKCKSSVEPNSHKILAAVGMKKTHESKILPNLNLRKTKSDDSKYNAILSTYPDMTIKIKPIAYKKSTCDHLQEICFCTTQMLKTKTDQCRSLVTVTRLDKIKPLTIFTPKEYWVQYHIQYSKLRKSDQNKQNYSKQNQTECTEIETIMPYTPRNFYKTQSSMLFENNSKYSNNICSFNSTSSKEYVSDFSSTYSVTELSNQLCLNCLHESKNRSSKVPVNKLDMAAVNVNSWNTSNSNSLTSRANENMKSKRFAFKTLNDRCTYNTSFRKKFIICRNYPRQFENAASIHLANMQKMRIRFVEKRHACYPEQQERVYLHKRMSSLSPKTNTYVDISEEDQKSQRKQNTRLPSKSSHSKISDTVSVSGFRDNTKHILYQRGRGKHEIGTDPFQRETKIFKHFVLEASSDQLYNFKTGRIESWLKSDLRRTLTARKFNDRMYYEKHSKYRKKPFPRFYCQKKGISKSLKRKVKCTLTNVEYRSPDSETRKDCVEESSILESKICFGSLIRSEYAKLEPECIKTDLLKTDSFKAKILICMNKMKLSSFKNLPHDQEVLEVNHGCRHPKRLKQIRQNFARAIKGTFRKPNLKYLNCMRRVGNANQKELSKPFPLCENPDDLRVSRIEMASLLSKPYSLILCFWPGIYLYFIKLVKVWRQLIHVLLFVLWSPCLFSAKLLKAFICCFIRFRLQCYLK